MYDVTIVGAGPVGLFLACELGLAGCSVLVLEQETEPDSPWRTAPLGLRGLSPASAEAFDRRGLLGPLLKASGVEPDAAVEETGHEPLPPRSVGHFGGITLDPSQVDVAALPFRLPGPAPEGVMTYLAAVESVLYERAVALGVEVRRGATAVALTQDEDGVTVRAEAHGDGSAHQYSARLLVGCDGGHSAVRRLAGFDFTGTGPRFTGYVMLAGLDDPGKLRPGFTTTPAGMYLRMPAEGHLGVLDPDGGAFDRSRTPDSAHLQEVLRRVSGTDVTVREVSYVSSFTDRAMQATTYRRGRVLLAGDAAHVHSPLGAQGLNLGIGDAVNLGWKLVATLRGHAPDQLLDTYTRERHPVGARVLERARAQTAAMLPDAHSQALQAVLRELLATRDGTTYMYEQLSGTAHRYDLADGDPGTAVHPLVGRTAPDLRLEDGTRLNELTRDGRGILLDLGPALGPGPVSGPADGGSLREVAQERSGRIRYVSGRARHAFGLGALLVRPDGIVACAADEHDVDPAGFARAADRWFGGPEAEL